MNNDWIYRRLEFHEGCVLKPYYDTEGKLSIGIGRCIDTNPFTEAELKAVGDWKKGITRNAALMLLRNDVARCQKELPQQIEFYDKLDLERKYALLDMSFQLGIKGLLGFKKMLGAMKYGNWGQAAKECLNSKYARQVPARAKRIARLIKEGIWLRE